jgi:hypothetical protein
MWCGTKGERRRRGMCIVDSGCGDFLRDTNVFL